MRKLLTPIFITIIMMISNNSFAQWTGSGTSASPYLITNKADLVSLATNVNNGTTYSGKYFIVTADINMTGGAFTPIGNATYKFQGIFNGNGKKITNLTVNSTAYAGLFGNISGARIENLGIEATTTTTINTAEDGFGGILVASANNSTINKCYALGTIKGTKGCNLGGLIGVASNNTTINNCYARATLTNGNNGNQGTRIYGGLVCSIDNSSISNSYSASTFSSVGNSATIGSLVGQATSSTITNSYYDITLSQNGNNSLGIPKASTDMKLLQFAKDLNACQPYTWRFLTSNYPVLYWQGTGADLPPCCTLNGSGTIDSPYEIYTPDDLNCFSSQVNGVDNYSSGKFFKLMNDIDMTGEPDFIPIGINNDNRNFTGNFDGQNHKITNITISSVSFAEGLFGKVNSGAVIKNLGIEGIVLTASGSGNHDSRNHGGGLAGHVEGSTISGCYVASSVSRQSSLTGNGNRCSIGGLIGYAGSTTTITNCYARAKIIETNGGGSTVFYGGFVGYISGSTITNSYSDPISFTSTCTNKGSLVGYIDGTVTAPNSYYRADAIASVTQPTGSSPVINRAIMTTFEFAMLLNGCQINAWKWTNSNNTINDGLPILDWQGVGTGLPLCFTAITTGTSTSSAYIIRHAADLMILSKLVNAGNTYSTSYFIVDNNISFISSGIDVSSLFNPIGNASDRSFGGKFNGNGKVISNLTVPPQQYSGIFGYTNGATIFNLGLDNITNNNSNTTAYNYVGGLAGLITNGSKVNECYIINSTIKGSDNTRAGGLLGQSQDLNTEVNNCYARANIIDKSKTSVSGAIYGGLIGVIWNNSKMYNSYSAPTNVVNAGTYGVLVGSVSGTNVNNYYDNTLSLTGYNSLGTPKTPAEMKSGCFPTHLNNIATPQVPVVWYKAKNPFNSDYPVLAWQKLSDGTDAGFEGNCLSVAWDKGDATNTFKVDEVKDLVFISNMTKYITNYSGKFFVLQNDISFNDCTNDFSSSFSPIGISGKPFSGNFNGRLDVNNRYAIANYKFSNTNSDNIGLFGYINGATIQNLGISNFNITAKDNVGGLVGVAEGKNTIDACFVYGHIKGVENVGGLVGKEIAGTGTNINTITKSFTNVTIDALTNVGGIVGQHSGSITNSYSNAEIYSSVSDNNYVGGIVGNANDGSSLNTVYSAAKIVRNGTTNTNFGKIRGSNLTTGVLNCYSRDSVFVNYTNISPSGYSGASFPNVTLRDPNSVTTLNTNSGATLWKVDFTDNINDGYPIFTYQDAGLKLTANGAWQNPTTASQIVIIPSGVQVKTSTANCPKAAYVKIENGGELNNQTNLSLFGEYNRELSVGKWNLIGLSTNNQNLASLINFSDTTTPYKTFVKVFDYSKNNWSDTTVTNINTPIQYGEGILVMPNYSLDANYLQAKSRIVSKGILFNESPFNRPFSNTTAERFVSLANNYPVSLNVNATSTPIAGNTASIKGGLVYVYDTENAKWNNNLQSILPVTLIKPSEGFFIAANDASGIFIFDKLANPSGAKNTIKSNLIYVKATSNNETREAFLELNSDAENGFDFNDGLMLFGSNMNAVEPFFRINAGKESFDSEIGELDILKDAFSTLPYTTELDLRSEKENDLSLRFSNLPSDIHVYLLDSLLNTAQYLNDNPDYSLKVNAGDNENRLFVLFSYNKEDINQFFKPEMAEEIRIWNYNNTLHIEGKNLIRYEIYDILGNRLLEEETFEDDYQKSLSLKNGIYIVRAYSKTSTKTEKISIYN